MLGSGVEYCGICLNGVKEVIGRGGEVVPGWMVYREKGGTVYLVRGEKGVIGEYLGARQEGPRGKRGILRYLARWG